MTAPPPVSRRMDRPPAGAPPAAVDPAPLLGRWESFDPATSGVLRLDLRPGEDGLLALRVTGAWHGGGRDWGAVAARPFAAAGFASPAAVAFHAAYDFGFAETTIAAYLNLRLLVVDAFTRYRDGLRAPVWSRDHLYQP
ncbi:MAG TPA: hypothetical protein VHM02_06185 [Thermoanaerobaculia bacterium]|nr:hypothetical protein [Thermoanaerobaculia bacterium]